MRSAVMDRSKQFYHSSAELFRSPKNVGPSFNFHRNKGFAQWQQFLTKEEQLEKDFMKANVQHKRQWRYTGIGKQRHRSFKGYDFRVMSYNILSQDALDKHGYLYRDCNPKFLNGKYRLNNIMDEILASHPDIICLQEVEVTAIEEIHATLNAQGFDGIYKKRTGEHLDGCCIYWRINMFELIEYKLVELRRQNMALLNRDNIAIIACLKPLFRGVSDVRLHVATTHLLFNPRRGDVKLCQLRLLFAELEDMAFISETNNTRLYHPIVFCGDLNLESNSLLYRFIEHASITIEPGMRTGDFSGQVEGKGKGSLTQNLRFSLEKIKINRSTRFEIDHSIQNLEAGEEEDDQQVFNHSIELISTRLPSAMPMPMTTCLGGPDGMIVDHMFYNPSRMNNVPYLCNGRLQLLGTVDLLYRRGQNGIPVFPNMYLSSDHIFIMSKFRILPKLN